MVLSSAHVQMVVVRLILIVWITLLVLTIAGCPGMFHSKQRREAHYKHSVSPSAETEREIQRAKELDRWSALRIQVVLLPLLGASIYLFVRAGKSMKKPDRKIDSEN